MFSWVLRAGLLALAAASVCFLVHAVVVVGPFDETRLLLLGLSALFTIWCLDKARRPKTGRLGITMSLPDHPVLTAVGFGLFLWKAVPGVAPTLSGAGHLLGIVAAVLITSWSLANRSERIRRANERAVRETVDVG